MTDTTTIVPSNGKLPGILVAMAAGISMLLSALNYPVIGHDAYVHLNWLEQFPNLFLHGVWYPRWLPDSFGGFGAPTFYFYAPLVYWVGAFLYSIGIHSPSYLYNFLALIFEIASFVSTYLVLRQIASSSRMALVGAAIYSFLAYRFCDVFIRDALTEHAALAFLPLVFISSRDRVRSIATYAVGWAGLLLTNLPIAYLGIFSILVFNIAERSYKRLAMHGLAFVIAIGASAVYLFPAFALRGFVHQRHLFDLDLHTSLFGFALLDLFQGHFDWLRISSIATAMGGVLILFWKSEWTRDGWKWVAVLALFFQLPFISAPLWHLIPGMPFVQFSWRWNGVLLLAIAVLFVRWGKERGSIQACVVIGLALVTILSELTIARNLFVPASPAVTWFHTDAPEYAPKWASNDPGEVIGIALRRASDPAAVLLGLTMPGDTVALQSRTATEWRFASKLSRPTSVRFHLFYWPFWKARTDSAQIVLEADPNGFLQAVLPAGQSEIHLELQPSPAEQAGRAVSIIGAGVLTILLAAAAYRSILIRREIAMPPASARKT